MNFIAGFLMGQMFGKRIKEDNTSYEEKVQSICKTDKNGIAYVGEPRLVDPKCPRHERVLMYVKANPMQTIQEIAKGVGETVQDTNVSLVMNIRDEKIGKTIDKKYYPL